MDCVPLLRRLVARTDLTSDETRHVFDALMDNQLEPAMTAALLAALAAKGECVAELVGAAEALRARATPVRLPPGCTAIDTCSTGGDGQPLFNVSTAVAIVAAAAGATVAKHGNRSNTRPSGSAEVLEALGVNVEADTPTVERCLAECRIAFLHAARLHPAMKHAAPIRRLLGIRTIFNLAGPLANPAGVRRQVVGVNHPDLVERVLSVLRELGTERAMVVHGLDGLCDLSIAAPSRVARWDGRSARVDVIDAAVIGAGPASLESLSIRSPAESAAVIRRVLAGQRGPARDMVVFNAAAALWVAGLADDWEPAAIRAREVLDDGSARALVEHWCQVSHN